MNFFQRFSPQYQPRHASSTSFLNFQTPSPTPAATRFFAQMALPPSPQLLPSQIAHSTLLNTAQTPAQTAQYAQTASPFVSDVTRLTSRRGAPLALPEQMAALNVHSQRIGYGNPLNIGADTSRLPDSNLPALHASNGIIPPSYRTPSNNFMVPVATPPQPYSLSAPTALARECLPAREACTHPPASEYYHQPASFLGASRPLPNPTGFALRKENFVSPFVMLQVNERVSLTVAPRKPNKLPLYADEADESIERDQSTQQLEGI